jgi:1-phosphofructokinase family hexose kinase
MICTITLNPALDKNVEVQDLIPHATNDVLRGRTDPGGKGINVLRVVKELGQETIALGIIGGETGNEIKNHLENRGIQTDFVVTDQPTRTNIIITDIDDPPPTELNEPGAEISNDIIEKVEDTIRSNAENCRLFVLAGSLPEGCPGNTYNRLISVVREFNCKAVLDTRDEALKEGIKAIPYMIKPNKSEAENLLGRKIESSEDAAKACRDFYEMGIKIAIISLGKDGAVMACEDGIFKAGTPRIKAESTVGSGDSMIAGICVGLTTGKSYADSLRLGAAAGTATATTPGTKLCTKKEVDFFLDKIEIEKIEIDKIEIEKIEDKI